MASKLMHTVTYTHNTHTHHTHTHTHTHTHLPQIINTYTEAVQTVDINQAVGKPNTLWVNFANFYEENEQLPEVQRLMKLVH